MAKDESHKEAKRGPKKNIPPTDRLKQTVNDLAERIVGRGGRALPSLVRKATENGAPKDVGFRAISYLREQLDNLEAKLKSGDRVIGGFNV